MGCFRRLGVLGVEKKMVLVTSRGILLELTNSLNLIWNNFFFVSSKFFRLTGQPVRSVDLKTWSALNIVPSPRITLIWPGWVVFVICFVLTLIKNIIILNLKIQVRPVPAPEVWTAARAASLSQVPAQVHRLNRDHIMCGGKGRNKWGPLKSGISYMFGRWSVLQCGSWRKIV